MAYLKLMSAVSTAVLAGTVTALGSQPAAERVPDPPRDFRGVWVATVDNIDWPSSRNLSSEEQKSEMLALLDQARDLNLNAVILQIRPTMDALYNSDLEPWSLYLTGTQGKAPDPLYDPLTFAVEEAHKRGLQLHTWLNPYRAHKLGVGSTETLAQSHVTRSKPDIVRQYGQHIWMDPTDPGSLAHNIQVFKDVVRRYDIDGVHMDDYFYPYPELNRTTKKDIEFPDDVNWEAYRKTGGTMSRGDWRRSKVNELVRALGKAIKEVRPTVQYGISPFGIWRPGKPPEIVGFDQYDKLYADAKLWLNEGWVDYFTPQLYWRIQDTQQSYPFLLKWWLGENKKKRHIWPGLFTSKIGLGAKAYTSDEIVNQIILTRFLGATGNIHFSYRTFKENRQGVNDKLTTGVYSSPALPPLSPWLDSRAPSSPQELKSSKGPDGTLQVTWETGAKTKKKPEDRVFQWAIYSFQGGRWTFRVSPASAMKTEYPSDKGALPTQIAVAAVDRLGNISPWKVLKLTDGKTSESASRERFGQVQ
jgi:uncharacterized lipoprotein YddW (UPF0748 family)